MILRRLIFLGFLIPTCILNAQTDFRSGYIIISEGDTIFGKIDYRSDLLMSTICKYQDTNKAIQEFAPTEILGFRFIDSKYYVSKVINGTSVFLEYLIKGKVNIYYMRDDKGDHYYLEKEDANLTEIPYDEGYKYVNNREVRFRTTKHIGVLYYYMQDAPQLKSRIENLQKPDHQYLIKLAEDYHNAVCEDEKCIIYEKRLPFVKVNFEIIGGFSRFQITDYIYDKNYSQAGVLAHFWLPRTNEKLYFRTGLLYSTIEEDGTNEAIFKIPIQIEYIYPRGIIRPVMAFGLNIYSSGFQSWVFTGGINLKLYKPVYLGIYYDIEFYSNEYIQYLPNRILSQSILTSLLIRL